MFTDSTRMAQDGAGHWVITSLLVTHLYMPTSWDHIPSVDTLFFPQTKSELLNAVPLCCSVLHFRRIPCLSCGGYFRLLIFCTTFCPS